MNLGENIHRLRVGKNMSQGDLANELDVSRQSVSKWENNSATPELDKLIKMSELFGVSLDELVRSNASIPPSVPSKPDSYTQTQPHRIIGVILLCFGLSVTLLLSILGGFIMGVMLGLPFTIIGCILISSKDGFLFKCAWALFAVYAPLLFYFMLNFIGFGWIIRWGVLLVWFTILGIATICLYRSGRMSDDSKKLMIGSVIVAAVLLILLGIANQAIYRSSGLYFIP